MASPVGVDLVLGAASELQLQDSAGGERAATKMCAVLAEGCWLRVCAYGIWLSDKEMDGVNLSMELRHSRLVEGPRSACEERLGKRRIAFDRSERLAGWKVIIDY